MKSSIFRQLAAITIAGLATLPALAQVELLSKAATPGVVADGEYLDTSADGRYVLFISLAPNVIDGQVDPDPDGNEDLFLYDRTSDTVSLVTHTGDRVTAATGRDFLSNPARISADGSTVVFSTDKTGLVAGFDPLGHEHRGRGRP